MSWILQDFPGLEILKFKIPGLPRKRENSPHHSPTPLPNTPLPSSSSHAGCLSCRCHPTNSVKAPKEGKIS